MNNLILTQIPVSDLVQMIAAEVATRMQSNNQQTRINPQIIQDKRFVGDKELAEYLGCTIQTINRLKKTGALPFHRYGRRYYYLKSEIDAAFKSKAS